MIELLYIIHARPIYLNSSDYFPVYTTQRDISIIVIGLFLKVFWNQTSHICWSPHVQLSFCDAQDCNSYTVLSPWFWKHFWSKQFFFEILLNLRYRFYSGACCQSTQSWWLFWCCVWPDLPRYKRPHVNLSLSITCHSTSLYFRRPLSTPTQRLHTRVLRDKREGCSWCKRSPAILLGTPVLVLANAHIKVSR